MKRILFLLVTLFLAGLSAACQKSGPSGAMLSMADRGEILAFSEPEMDNLLAGWNQDDYAIFSKDFDQDLLKSMTRDEFDKLKNKEFTGLGRYHSREVESVVKRSDGSYTVIYYVVFDNNDEVLVRVKFQADEPHKISGLTLNK